MSEMMELTVTLSAHFSAAHLYHNKNWSDEKNREIFGKCFSAFGHGHDYRLEVEVPANQSHNLKAALASLVSEIDHQHLNFEIAEFKSKIPTTENLALYCKSRLEQTKQSLQILSLKLFERPDLWVTIGTC